MSYIEKSAVIKSTAIIGDNVIIGKNCYIDDNVIIKDNVVLGDDCYVGTGSILGEFTMSCIEKRCNKIYKLLIGNSVVIRSNTIIYTDSIIGDNTQTGHHVTIREKCKIGAHASIGSYSDIQGYCNIGIYTRLHSNVFVSQKSKIGNYVWLFPHVLLANDTTPPSNYEVGPQIDDFAVIAARSIILPGIHIEGDSLIAAGSNVTKDVHQGEVVGGNPAKVISTTEKIKNRKNNEKVYPWRYTFDRGMPWESIGFEKWYHSLTNKEKGEYFPNTENDFIIK